MATAGWLECSGMLRFGVGMSLISRLVGGLLGLPPVRTPAVRVVRDLAIPADDGVVLLADRYYPAGHETAPLILIRTPYGRRSANIILARLFAERGYQVLMQALRGTDGSGGRFEGFVINRGDGPATIDWLRRQDWFPGAFATWGASYLGYAQWDLASTSIAEWKAAIIDVSPASFYHHFMYPGGAFAIGNALGWAQLVHNLFSDRRSTNPSTMSAFTATRRLARACDQLPVAASDQAATGRTLPYYQGWVTHETYNSYWQRMDYRGNTANLPPIVHLGGDWADFFLPDVLDNYSALTATGRTVRLLVGSVEHGRNMATRTYQRDIFAILDRAFGREHEELPVVRLRITGRNQWRDEPCWPPANDPVSWYAQPSGGLATTPAPNGAPSRYRYDPANPTPTIGGTAVGLRAGARDNRPIERRPDVLTFTSDPLPTDLTVIGAATATIHIRSTLTHTDVFTRLCDVHPRGRSLNICDGLTRLHTDNAPPDGDGVRPATVELWPTGHVLRAGHRIRLQISSGAHPRFNRNHGTGKPLTTSTELRAAELEIFHDPHYQTAIHLPIIQQPLE